MKHLFLLFVGFFFCSNLLLSQQKKLFKIDTTLRKPNKNNALSLLDSTFFGNNHVRKDSSFIKNFKFSTNNMKLKHYNMPIFIPKGNYKMELNKIDTTKHYSLRIIKPLASSTNKKTSTTPVK